MDWNAHYKQEAGDHQDVSLYGNVDISDTDLT